MNSRGGWILEVDIQKFFDTLDHAHLRRLLRHRVRDGVLTRLIGKWLKAGVLEEGVVTFPRAGSPQGGVISPVLSNIFLHYVLDEWIEQVVKPRLRGKAFLIRYADDFVMGFTHEQDARRVLAVLAQRLGKYGLAIHPEKTRLIAFQEPTKAAGEKDAGSRPPAGTFTFLGFTHYWGRSPRGRWVVKRKTASSRLSRALQSIALWCRANRHRPLKEQQHMLSLKLRGHFAYYGITGNSRSLAWFRFEVARCWRKWLNRRNRERSLDWNIFNRLLERYPLPPVRVVHSVYHRAASP
jgi:group II intron reverse transcriptase/maturase